MKAKKQTFLAVILLLILVLNACGSTKLAEGFDEKELTLKAEEIITLFNQKDSETLLNESTALLKTALTDEVLKTAYEALDECGAFEEITSLSWSGHKDKSSGEDFAVATVKVKYALRTATYTLSFTKQLKLTGFYYR